MRLQNNDKVKIPAAEVDIDNSKEIKTKSCGGKKRRRNVTFMQRKKD